MAKLLDHESVPSTKTELDLFTTPPTQVCIESGYWHVAKLINTCTNDGPYEFHVQADPFFLDLSKNYLYMQLKIVKADGTAMVHNGEGVDPDQAGPINLIGKTFIHQVKIQLNSKLAFDSGDMYAYRAFLETEMNYGVDAKGGLLQSGIYSKDRPADRVDSIENAGLISRSNLFQNSTVVEVMAPIHSELFMSDRLMMSNMDLRMQIHRNSDRFCLMSFKNNPEYKIYVEHMEWYVRKVEISKSIHLAIEGALLKHPAKYPVRRIVLTKLHIAGGSRSTPTNTLFTGQIPRRLVIGCVDSDAFYGTYTKSPFYFKHFNINQISVTAGGVQFPQDPLVMDFERKQYMRPFVQLYEGLGIGGEDRSNGIGLADFKLGNCLFVFDLTRDSHDSGHWELMREGATTLNMLFAADVPANGIELIVYAEFDNLVSIDRFRNVHLDYTL